MIRRIQSLPQGQRVLIYFLLLVGGILIFLACGLLLTAQSFGTLQRIQSQALVDDVTVSEFVALPDEDAYPAAVAIAPDGLIYTGSYVSGAVWRITPDGGLVEIPNTRDEMGSVTGLTVAPDGTLYVLDRIEPLTAAGAVIWRIPPDGEPQPFAAIDDPDLARGGFDDIALDGAGRVYVTDRAALTIWRFAAEGGGDPVAWWVAAADGDALSEEPTGLDYSPQEDALLLTDPTLNVIYQIPVQADDPAAMTTRLYDHGSRAEAPGFDGIAITPDGTIYVTALAQNRVARLDGESLVYLADRFRGASDLAYDPDRDRLIVTNWNQFGLVAGSSPQLPFALDAIDLTR